MLHYQDEFQFLVDDLFKSLSVYDTQSSKAKYKIRFNLGFFIAVIAPWLDSIKDREYQLLVDPEYQSQYDPKDNTAFEYFVNHALTRIGDPDMGIVTKTFRSLNPIGSTMAVEIILSSVEVSRLLYLIKNQNILEFPTNREDTLKNMI